MRCWRGCTILVIERIEQRRLNDRCLVSLNSCTVGHSLKPALIIRFQKTSKGEVNVLKKLTYEIIPYGKTD